MGTTCIIGVDDQRILKDFVRAHVEMLKGEKVCVSHWYPDYRYEGRTIRYFNSLHPLQQKAKKILPHALYHRMVTKHELELPAIHDSIAGFMREHNVDVILAEFGPSGADIAPHARALGIPLVVHFHGHDAHRTSVVEAYRARYREMFASAYRVLSVSRLMTRALVDLGADPAKIVYNPYGPRESFFDVQSDYRSTILSLGRFTDIKANYLALMAFRTALEAYPDARLVMVGDGELLEVCKTLARVWGIDSCVSFPGAVPHAAILSYFESARCFVQHSITPSYGDAEGTPVTILEAGAAGLPVIATRHAGIPDVVVDGETGFLVKETDVDEMSRFMCLLLSDEGLAREMGESARKHIRSSFSLDQHIARLQDVIDSARHS